MTLAQMACGILWGMVLLSQTAPGVRGSMLLLFVTAFFFGIFRLNTRQFFMLMLLASGVYGGLILFEWDTLHAVARRRVVTQWLFLSVVLVWMSFMGGYVARLRANLVQAKNEIEKLANQDHLTGTSNRRAISGSLDEAMKQARETDTALSVCLLDLDKFKQINDKYGHLAGDTILREFVGRIMYHLRAVDFLQNKDDGANTDTESKSGPLGRFGGEEFLVILPGTDSRGAQQAAERLRATISDSPFTTEAGPVPVTVSIGVASFKPGDSDEYLLRRADRALYQSKDQGRNRVSALD